MKKYYIGIDLGGTNIKIALLGKKFNILKKTLFPTALHKKPSQVILAIKNAIDDMLSIQRASLKEVFGIGIGVAGLVNAKEGLIHSLVNIPGWRGMNIKKMLQKITRVPVYADNDANVMAIAEFRKGAGKGCRNLICVTLGTGVGGGIILNGNIYRGSTFSAGEIGHIPLNEKGPRCNCGGFACIESYIGNKYMMKELARKIKSGGQTVLKEMTKGDLSGLTPELLYRAAKRGDRLAREFWRELGAKLGIALTGIINVFDPDSVIIGGGVADAGEFLFATVRSTVKARAMEVQKKHVKILKAKLGQDSGLVGAGILVEIEKGR
ncbi:MAG: ROK family protein [Candidatus Omnitrophota bacterium]